MSAALSASAPPSPAELRRVPTMIGKYRILGRLGDGATSEVFLAYDDFQGRTSRSSGSRLAPRDPMDARYSERFFAAEAALVGRLQHPNVVQIFDACPTR
jgi:serine/threonine protein kinase